MAYIIRKIQDSNPKDITCGIIRDLITLKDFKKMDLSHITITDETKKHYHKELTECYYVLKGSIAVEIDGKIENLEKGSLIMIYPNTNHNAWKTSKKDAEILVVCCPPWSEKDEVLVE